jgi:C4-dicarboxylate transporter DctQ subunit
MNFLRRLDRGIAAAETAILVVLLAVMVLLDFTQVVLRNVFSSGITWVDTFLRQMVLWIAFLGASLAVQNRRHLSIDVLTRFLSEPGKRVARLVTDLFATVVCLAFLKASLKFVSSELAHGSTIFLDLPTWYFEVIIPVGYTMLAFRFFLKSLEDVMELKKGFQTTVRGS